MSKKRADRARESTQTSPFETATDIGALIQMVMREAYRQNQEDLRLFADKVRQVNKQKKAMREYLARLRGFRAEALRRAREAKIDPCNLDEEAEAALARLFDELAIHREAPDEETALIGYELCIPERVPPAGTASFGDLDAALTAFEGKLQSIGDDAQLANLDLQMALQKVQQAIQTLSSISKVQHDTVMAIIRNLKG